MCVNFSYIFYQCFVSIRMGMECPTNYNPADFYIQALATVPKNEIESSQRTSRIADNFAVSKLVLL